MWNQGGSPSMFEGKTFLPLHGIPIACNERSRTKLADWLPDPLTVPTRIARSLTEGWDGLETSATGSVSTPESVDGMVRLESKEHGHHGQCHWTHPASCHRP